MRIVSLLASATEIVCALGLKEKLVGCSHECDFPKSVESLPACSEPKLNIHTSAKEIDRQVKDVVRESLSVYRVHKDILKELKPDIIVTQDHCEVCAVSLKDVEQAVCDWVEYAPKVVSLHPENLEDIYKSIEQVSVAAGCLDRAKVLNQSIKSRINKIVSELPQRERKLKVACIEWMEPLMAAGNWVPELVELLGAENVIGVPGKHSPWMEWKDLKEKDPDIIMIMPCGWDIERSKEEMHVLTSLEGWNDLSAVKEKQVYVTDGNQYFNRPGPRIIDSLEIMAEILYPEEFNYRHKGVGWVPLES